MTHQERKALLPIMVCMLLSIGLVVCLAAIADSIRQKRGSFVRLFPSHPVLEDFSVNIKFNSYSIAGGTDHQLYLRNSSAPFHILIVNAESKDTSHVTISMRGSERLKFSRPRVIVDSPRFYFADGSIPFIYSGSASDWSIDSLVNENVFFQELVPLENSFFIRSVNKRSENILGKIPHGDHPLMMCDDILEKQFDGIFCTDGRLLVDHVRNHLVYLYRFRNEFITMDTSLNVLRQDQTIDTTTIAKIKVDTIQSSGLATILNPDAVVNKGSYVYKDWLFVNSNLLAKNEQEYALKEASVIDVYRLTNGVYDFSFYISDFKGEEKLRDFAVFGDKIYCLFNTHLQVFSLNKLYFNGHDHLVSR